MSVYPSVRWTLSIGFLENAAFVPVEHWDPSTTEPLLALARPVMGQASDPQQFRFRVHDVEGSIVWDANAREHKFPDRGVVFVADRALMPEHLQLADHRSLELALENGEGALAVLPLTLSTVVSRTAAAEVTRANDIGDINDAWSEGCEAAIATLLELRQRNERMDARMTACRGQLVELTTGQSALEDEARKLLTAVSAGELPWLNLMNELSQEIDHGLAEWRRLVQPLGTGVARDHLVELMRGAAATRSFYRLESWDWLGDEASIRERRFLIENVLRRHEQYGLHG